MEKGEQPLPEHPPKGMRRYIAFCQTRITNPFKVSRFGQGALDFITQTVDVDEKFSFEQVEEWAREAAKRKGYVFDHLERA